MSFFYKKILNRSKNFITFRSVQIDIAISKHAWIPTTFFTKFTKFFIKFTTSFTKIDWRAILVTSLVSTRRVICGLVLVSVSSCMAYINIFQYSLVFLLLDARTNLSPTLFDAPRFPKFMLIVLNKRSIILNTLIWLWNRGSVLWVGNKHCINYWTLILFIEP